MKLEPIVKEAVINFGDCTPQYKEFMLDAFNKIAAYENIDSVDPNDFEVMYASTEPTNNFYGAFVTSIFGSYLLHDMRYELAALDQDETNGCIVLFYSLSKLCNEDKIN